MLRYAVFLFMFANLFSETDTQGKPLLFNLKGIYTHPISTKSPLAQQYFDQGMVFYYGFNFDEAERSFSEAVEIDPDCAICYWGRALALKESASSLNDTRFLQAGESIQKAQKLIANATPQEQAYIIALVNAYLPRQDSFQALNRAYMNEMKNVSTQFPEDLDVTTLSAKAEMDLNPTDDYKNVINTLNGVLSKNPNHPGANHYYIHAVEDSSQIEKGLSSAKKLEQLIPFVGHLLHMPAHVYFRIGDYHGSSLANERAVKADEDLFARNGLKGDYFAGFYFHSHQFLIASLVMEGKKAEALQEAQKVKDIIAKEKPALSSYSKNALTAQRILILQRFNDWDQILKEPEPGSPYANGMWHFSRFLAYMSKDELELAKKEAALIQNEHVDQENHALNTLLKVAYFNALAAIDEKLGNQTKMIEDYQEAIKLEDTNGNADPLIWYMSSREALGNALLRANKVEQAEAMFREDLKIHPKKIWSEKTLKP